jgi:disulfide bond formation protein DsbB
MKTIFGPFLIMIGLLGLIQLIIKDGNILLIILSFIVFGYGLELTIDDKVERLLEKFKKDE